MESNRPRKFGETSGKNSKKRTCSPKGSPKTPVETPVETLVKTPERILSILTENPTMTLAEVAQNMDKSLSAVERALKWSSKANSGMLGLRKAGIGK